MENNEESFQSFSEQYHWKGVDKLRN